MLWTKRATTSRMEDMADEVRRRRKRREQSQPPDDDEHDRRLTKPPLGTLSAADPMMSPDAV